MSTFKRGIDFCLDDFNQQKILNKKDSIVQLIVNLFMFKPGNLPGLPHIGLDINEYLYNLEDFTRADELKQKILIQCNEIAPYLITGEVSVVVVDDDTKGGILFVSIPLQIDGDEELLLLGFKKDKTTGAVKIDYELQKKIFNVGGN